jgi:Tat protein secretion system quality control protein TatD with DNase activity
VQYVDTHSHIAPGVDFEQVIEGINANNVSHIGIMPRGGATEEEVVEFHKRYPDRVIPFYGGCAIQSLLTQGSNVSINKEDIVFFQGYRQDWWERNLEKLIEQIEKDLKGAPYRGIGEIRLRHYGNGPKVPEKQHDYNFPANSPFMFRLVDLAAKLSLPVAIHMEAESKDEHIKFLGKSADEDTPPPFERLLNHNKDALIIWCHLGRATPEVVKRMLDKHPNLYTDISDVQPRGNNTIGVSPASLAIFWEYTLKNSIIDEDGCLGENWKKLFMNYPDRIMIGCDAMSSKNYGRMYSALMNELKNILSQLSSEVAQMIAYENVKKIFKIN